MKKFNFKLQRILEIKQKLRDLDKQDLSRKASEYNLELSKIRKLQEEKKNAVTEMKNISRIEDLQMFDKYIVSNEKMQEYKRIDALKKEKPFKEAMAKYLEKDREVKILEKLKQKLYQEFLRDSQKEESQEIDEIVLNKYREDNKHLRL
ncbi:MAG: hypothetical protein N2712_07260 [Brevinematales bacterium]|nr:hypothetical protein [Brevinematales bacterium]